MQDAAIGRGLADRMFVTGKWLEDELPREGAQGREQGRTSAKG